jgi:hypothetical protein
MKAGRFTLALAGAALLLTGCSGASTDNTGPIENPQAQQEAAQFAAEYYVESVNTSDASLNASRELDAVVREALGNDRFTEVYSTNAGEVQILKGLDKLNGEEVTEVREKILDKNPVRVSINFGELGDEEQIVVNQFIVTSNAVLGMTNDIYDMDKATVEVDPKKVTLTGESTATVDLRDVMLPVSANQYERGRDLGDVLRDDTALSEGQLPLVKGEDNQWKLDAEAFLESMMTKNTPDSDAA